MNEFMNMKIIKTKYASRYMYVLTKLEVHIYILNTNESIIKNLHEKQMTQGYTCISKVLVKLTYT